MPALPLDGFQQRRFFSADVCACSAVNNQIQIESRIQYVFAQIPLVISFLDRPVQDFSAIGKLPANVNESLMASERIGGDNDSLQSTDADLFR